MKMDRYTRIVLTVIAVALVALAARPWLGTLVPGSVEAQTAAPKYELTVPKAWGTKILSFSNNNLLLEASDGTLRIVDLEGKAPEYPKIKVQFRFQ